jgi:hypothetical protein
LKPDLILVEPPRIPHAGLTTWKEHISVSSTVIMAPFPW